MKLCIDPGHGMSNRRPGVYDPGAMARVRTIGSEALLLESEAEYALQVGLTLKWLCEQYGLPWFLTRHDDRSGIPLGKRDELASKEECTHYLSIHLNSGGGSGTEVYYRDERDRSFGSVVLECALEAWGLPNRGLRPESHSARKRLSVMDFDGPSALLEIGFIDSPVDLSRIKERDSRIRFGRLLMEALRRQ